MKKLRITICTLLILALTLGIPFAGFKSDLVKKSVVTEASAATEVRGLWLAFCDFEELGLKDATESQFRTQINKILNKAVYVANVNRIYFHVRAFDDAAWKSKTFPASKHLTSRASTKKTAYNTYSYDPLKIVLELAHKKNIKVEAWMNPYRYSYDYFYNPARKYSTDRLLKAVQEVMKYDVDGIHFDDYFYHAGKGYYKAIYSDTRKEVTDGKIKVAGKSNIVMIKETVSPKASEMRKNVNAMVKQVYQQAHSKDGVRFGISPAGNYENCMASGADVKTWLSREGYVDYLVPQIYWTDHWGSDGKTTMFTDRMNLFKSKNVLGKPMYIGLALYRTGYAQSDDRGWGWYKTNMRAQVKKVRRAGLNGFVFFSALDLFDKDSSNERFYLKGLLKPIKAESIKIKIGTRIRTAYTAKKGKSINFSIIWNPKKTNPRVTKVVSSNPKIVKVITKRQIKALKAGTATITVTEKNGKAAKLKVTVK